MGAPILKKYIWNGTGDIHTPSGVVKHKGTFTSGHEWISQHPQRRWLRQGLITEVKEEPKPEPKKSDKTEKAEKK